ncbi:MAG: hypothetical protein R3E32_13745 [Chitinophagales bacterium]
MLKTLWQKVQSYKREEKGESLRQASKNLGIPKSTLHYQEQPSIATDRLFGNRLLEYTRRAKFLKADDYQRNLYIWGYPSKVGQILILL